MVPVLTLNKLATVTTRSVLTPQMCLYLVAVSSNVLETKDGNFTVGRSSHARRHFGYFFGRPHR